MPTTTPTSSAKDDGKATTLENKLAALHEVGMALVSARDLKTIVQSATDAATKASGAEFGAFFYNVIEPSGESYTLYTISGVPEENFSKFPMPRNTAVFAPTFNGDGIVRSADITQDPRYGRNDPHYGMPKGHLPVRSYLAVPVISRSGEVLGGMFFGHHETAVFSDESERLVAIVAAHAAVAIDNARLHQALQEQIAGYQRSQHALAESQERFRMVLGSIELGFWYCDLPLDKLQWDARVKEHFWLPPDAEVTIAMFFERLHPDDRERTRLIIEHCIANHSNYDVDYRTVSPDGQIKWIRAVGRTFYDPDGTPRSFDGITMDITDRMRNESALRNSEKLAATGRLAATIAHEINNPLEALTNLLYLLRSYVAETEGVQYLEAAEAELARVSGITKQTLAFYRETAAAEDIDLPALIDSVVLTLARKVAQSRVMLVRNDTPCQVHGLKGELRQLFSNILVNAIEAVEVGERVDISITCSASEAIVQIKDNGHGIAPEHLPALFEPFFTAKKQFGTGLGLWVAQEVATKHGGRITVESSTTVPGHGTCFQVALPLATKNKPGSI